MNAMDLRRVISMAVDAAVRNLKGIARMISISEEKAQDVNTLYNELEVAEGTKLNRDYSSPHFINNQKNKKRELNDPLILVHDKKISNMHAVAKVMELAMKVCSVKAPGFGETKKANLHDLVILTSAEVTVSKEDTVILDGAGDKKAIEGRAEQLGSAIEQSFSDFDKEKLRERLAKLSGGVAVLKIGGASEAEVGVQKERVTDALNATKAAVEEGIMPGGSIALLCASKDLDKLQTANFDQKIGVQIIQNALKV
ncbi:hypothetical protein SEVIR_9G538401v4 [Setaria viridis]